MQLLLGSVRARAGQGRLCPSTAPISISVSQVWGQAKLGQSIAHRAQPAARTESRPGQVGPKHPPVHMWAGVGQLNMAALSNGIHEDWVQNRPA